MNEAHGLGRRRTARACNPGDRNRNIRPRPGDGSLCHGSGNGLAHCAMGCDEIRGDADEICLGLVGIGHEPTLHHGRGTWDFGEERGHEPTGAGLGRRDLQSPFGVTPDEPFRPLTLIAAQRVVSGRRMVAAA
jgi:hypothetical protein